MKTIGIVASPRREGNTAKIVEAILEGAEANGSKTEVIHLGDLEIAPCNACESNTYCWGCRASAYHYSGDANGLDPKCWLIPANWQVETAPSS